VWKQQGTAMNFALLKQSEFVSWRQMRFFFADAAKGTNSVNMIANKIERFFQYNPVKPIPYEVRTTEYMGLPAYLLETEDSHSITSPLANRTSSSHTKKYRVTQKWRFLWTGSVLETATYNI
jgi:hypothetical protein